MAHPSNSPLSIDSAPPTISKPLPSVISDASAQSQSNHSAGHHVQWSDPLVYTRGIPARQPQEAHPASPTVASSVTFNHSARHDTGTIAGVMEGPNLVPAASGTPSAYMPLRQTFQPLHSQLTSTFQAAHQGSSFIAAPRNPNLRFIFSRRLQLAQSREPLNPVDSIVVDDRPATSEPQRVLNQPNGTVESTTTYVTGTPPPTPTVTEDAIDLTLGSDEENSLLQKQRKNQKSTQKQRNTQILSTSIKVNTAKRRLDSESSDTSEGGPQKRLKRKGALRPRLDSDSATSDIDLVSPGPRSSIEPSSSSGRFSSSSVEVVDDVVLDGPRSIADARNNHAEPSISHNDTQAPKHSARGSGVSVVVRSYKRPAPGGSAVASSSRVRVEDMEVSDDEVETGDPQRALLYASAISRKVRMWAGKLKGISRADIEALFDDNVEIMSKGEILKLLKDIDHDKDWATRAEVQETRLERYLIAVVTDHLVNGTEAYKLAVRILDNFAQRFRGERYPRTRR
ncbi:uncharacterized protein F5147DRAFT_667872 [Suillus discolor]|uniref:Uncharacterized protein n=1 Tax=Suillus discolor TaxID=1912936 RepID=A0A9P7FJK3_9AGAM|nr:uncharacterized protein F5147DRAFT_667872 [Suillus discolor]KAG2119024.1 hypothetical protein F5147DRAFT_667872 [Suillus discolor]